jgi:hypothetical protein
VKVAKLPKDIRVLRVRIPTALCTEAGYLAVDRRSSLADVVREALEDFVTKHARNNPVEGDR